MPSPFLNDQSGGAQNLKVDRAVYAAPTFKVVLPAAGTYYINLAGLVKPSATNIGMAVHSDVAVNVSVSARAFSEVQADVDAGQASGPWTPNIAVVANVFKVLSDASEHPVWGSSMRITSTSAGVCYVTTL